MKEDFFGDLGKVLNPIEHAKKIGEAVDKTIHGDPLGAAKELAGLDPTAAMIVVLDKESGGKVTNVLNAAGDAAKTAFEATKDVTLTPVYVAELIKNARDRTGEAKETIEKTNAALDSAKALTDTSNEIAKQVLGFLQNADTYMKQAGDLLSLPTSTEEERLANRNMAFALMKQAMQATAAANTALNAPRK